jgi:hypothetical protein
VTPVGITVIGVDPPKGLTYGYGYGAYARRPTSVQTPVPPVGSEADEAFRAPAAAPAPARDYS